MGILFQKIGEDEFWPIEEEWEIMNPSMIQNNQKALIIELREVLSSKTARNEFTDFAGQILQMLESRDLSNLDSFLILFAPTISK